MPSGWYLFPVNIFPVCCRSSNSFHHLRRPTYLLLPSRISSTEVSIPVVPHLRYLDSPPMSSPLTLSAIPIILHLHHTYIVILPRLCCGPHRIIFHRPVYFAAVVCLPYPIGSSPCYLSFCTKLISPLCSTLIFSLFALIFSQRFYFLFRHGSSLST